MKFIQTNRRISGIAIPVSAINSTENLGCGEFADLRVLAKWCADADFKVIQILPVFDTGLNPSPYSSLSGFALNPIYLKIGDIEYSGQWNAQIADFRNKERASKSIRYKEIYNFKIEILNKIFDTHAADIIKNPDLNNWIKNCEWIHSYCAFKILSEMNDTIVWSKWDYDPVYHENSKLKEKQLQEFLKLKKDRFYFYSWIQFLLENQLAITAEIMNDLGVNLKGDLPILIDRESCDVWFHRELFRMNLVAGAPPDNFSKEGQNWGFPVYNLENMDKDHYHWWKKRISRLNLFFHAIRLDHIIGFMRLWQFPISEQSALMGYFSHSDYINAAKIIDQDIDLNELENLAIPAITADNLTAITDKENVEHALETYLTFSPEQRIYFLKNTIQSENAIANLFEKDAFKNLLKMIYRNRIFIKVSEGNFAPIWGFENSGRFHSLHEEKKSLIQRMVHEYYKNSERIWYEHGKKFLSTVQTVSDFLFCGEDLGAVPEMTSRLLEEQHILSLKVLRWTRLYKEHGAPFVDPPAYPPLSVATSSVHDSENIRQWWNEDMDGRNKLYSMMGETEGAPPELTPEIAMKLLKWFFNASSQIVIIPIQDLFSIDEKYRINSPTEERINIPGQVLESNWVYKMPGTIESLASDQNFLARILTLTNIRT